MSQRFIRCAHCGLPHEGHVTVCPTTGLRIDRPVKHAQRRKRAQGSRDESPERLLGTVLDGKYHITALLGQGGMSAIYEALDFAHERHVAIKVLHPVLADDPEAIARLRHEAQVVSAVSHPNICQIYDLGRTPEGVPYLVMERLVGLSLAERIREGPMPFFEVAPLVVQILAALDAAHRLGVIHRDLKPENVFIERPGTGRVTAKLLDFGISKSMGYDFVENARLTHTGMVMGTPYYMAPEQARGDSGLDQRVDLWAVGVILYEALSGRRPFVATNYNALLVKILTSRPRPLEKVIASIPSSVSWLVDKALSKLREDRFQSAREFSEALQRVQHAIGVHDHQTTTVEHWHRSEAPALASTRVERTAARRLNLSGDEEDPETLLDSDVGRAGDPATRATLDDYPATRATLDDYPATRATLDDYVPEPIEPTIQDRAREIDYEEDVLPPRDTWQPPPDPSDTEVMRRRDLEALAAKEQGRPLPEEDAHDTEVIHRARLRSRTSRPEPSSAGERDTLVPDDSDPGGWSETEGEAPQDEALEAASGEKAKPAKKGTRYPDSERTMLYDIDAAKKKLRARRRARGSEPGEE